MSINKNLTIGEAFTLAVKKHQKNNFKEAQNLYNQVLKINPDHVSAHNNLGAIFQVLKRNQEAISCYEKAIKIDPNCTDAHNNLGVVYQELEDYQKAISSYEKIIKIDPKKAVAFNNLGSAFKSLGERQKAKDCFEKAVELDPNYVNAHYNIGVAFGEMGDYFKAINSYEKAIELNPNYKNAHNNLGGVFDKLEEYQKAKSCFQNAIEIDPDFTGALGNVAGIYVSELDDFEKAISTSNETLKIHHKNSKFNNQSIGLFRLKHDVEQAKYLNKTGGFWNYFRSKDYKINGIDEFIKIGDEILKRKENEEDKNNSNKVISLNPNEINSLLPYFKENHIYKTKTISGSCINPNKNWLEVEEEYLNSHNQIMYIDDFLSDEALIELREFCLVSKVWNKEYNNKYLGAFSNSGFISPIHLQIAIDLQQKLPKLFGPHRLGKFWGFKYDATLGKGINIHADFAIHNLNFWITPDEYNNNKNSGGLKIYDAPAPDHWTFNDYNINTKKIYEFLKENNAKCTNVPYKFNRAVLFNSAYFHETDEIDFKDEYVGRRINNTYLFGTRVVKKSK